MRIFRSLGEVPKGFGPSAVTIGKFDGVHLGHQHMIRELLEESRRRQITPVALTFDRNPLSILAPAKCPPSLISNEQKFELLQSFGIEATFVLKFDHEQSLQSAEAFVQEIVFDGLGSKVVYAGADFRYGHGGRGDVRLLDEMGRELGFEVKHVPEIESDGRRISSTWIRQALLDGDIELANRLLGRSHELRANATPLHLDLVQTAGFQLEEPIEGLVPAPGVYLTELCRSNSDEKTIAFVSRADADSEQVEVLTLVRDSGTAATQAELRELRLRFLNQLDSSNQDASTGRDRLEGYLTQIR